MNALRDKLEEIQKKISLVSANLANAASQLKAGKVISPGIIDDIYNELTRLNAEKARIERAISSQQDDASIADVVYVSVETMADWLCMTPRNVQILADKGIAIRDARGQYRLKESVKSYIRELHRIGDGKYSEYNKERTEAMRLRRQQAEVEYLEKLGTLVDAAAVRAALEKAKAHDRQRWLLLPKHLALELEGKTVQEMEVILESYARESLNQLAALEIGRGTDIRSIQNNGPAAQDDTQPMGRRKKVAERKKHSPARAVAHK